MVDTSLRTFISITLLLRNTYSPPPEFALRLFAYPNLVWFVSVQAAASAVVDEPSAENDPFNFDGLDNVDGGAAVIAVPVLARTTASASAVSSRSRPTDRIASLTPPPGVYRRLPRSRRRPAPQAVADADADSARRGSHDEAGDAKAINAEQAISESATATGSTVTDYDKAADNVDHGDYEVSLKMMAADATMWLFPVDVSYPIVSRHARAVEKLDKSEPYSGPEPPDYPDTGTRGHWICRSSL